MGAGAVEVVAIVSAALVLRARTSSSLLLTRNVGLSRGLSCCVNTALLVVSKNNGKVFSR
jgi:hypothetical protein